MKPVIETNALGKIFPEKKRTPPVVALRDLSLQVQQQTIFGFVGPNGAGKSTTIKLLLGFIKATQGDASLFKIPVTDEKSRKQVGYLPENPVFHDYLTAKEVLETSAALKGVSRDQIQKHVLQLLERVNLPTNAKRAIRGFSKGMTQRLGIANALVGNPDLLILDEPMSGLDPLGRNMIRELMLTLRKEGKTIFFSSHILHDVETICDEIAILFQGELKFTGRLSDIFEQKSHQSTIQFHAENAPSFLESILEQQMISFSSIDQHNTFECTVTREDLSTILPLLLDNKCEIISVQQQYPTLEDFFLQLIDTNKKTI